MKIIIFLIFISSTTFAASWDSANSPYKLIKDPVANFSMLPLTADLSGENLYWPSYYWPYNRGGVGYRWNKQENVYNSKTFSEAEINQMTRDELANLSPIEKLDILNDDYQYNLTKLTKKYANNSANDWNGICHGMASASLYYEEPKLTSIRLRNNKILDFYTSDIKALLGVYYTIHQDRGVKQIGKRCFFNSRIMTRLSACKDVNAGSLHLLLTNLIGLKQKSFIIDLDRYKEVWNHPIIGFESVVLEEKLTKIKVKTKVFYPRTVEPHLAPLIGSSLDYIDQAIYEYWLDLDEKGDIIGGSWVSFNRPDFIWLQDKLNFENSFKNLDRLLN